MLRSVFSLKQSIPVSMRVVSILSFDCFHIFHHVVVVLHSKRLLDFFKGHETVNQQPVFKYDPTPPVISFTIQQCISLLDTQRTHDLMLFSLKPLCHVAYGHWHFWIIHLDFCVLMSCLAVLHVWVTLTYPWHHTSGSWSSKIYSYIVFSSSLLLRKMFWQRSVHTFGTLQ